MKKIHSPNSQEVVYILRNFSSSEKISFFILVIIFTVSSLALLWKINNHFLTEIPSDGGTLIEGVVGTPRFINPVLEISDTDRDIGSLVYSGLMRPDGKGGLIPDLAEKFEISDDGLIYTFTLKPDLKWQDGKDITSDDIVFTITQTKDPTLKSPRRANWEGVEIEKIDDRSVRFILKKPYTPFLENTTMGIIPKHIWQNAVSEQMGFSEFNINPIGSGPYQIDRINRNSSGIATSYELSPNKKFALGQPHIQKLMIQFYNSQKDLLSAYQKGEIDSISAIAPQTAQDIKKSSSTSKTISLPRVFGVFFNQNNNKIFVYKEVREALNLATPKEKIIDEVLGGFGTQLDYPIPPGTFGAISASEENNFSIENAKKILEKNGWVFKDNVWQKKDKKEILRLEFSLSTSDANDLKQTAEILKSTWEQMGIKINLRIFEIGDLNQNIIRPRKYDALLFGEIVGRDPDPFAFWHSSQRNDPGLNVAMYANIKVDKLLEEARATADDQQRAEKYAEFQKEVYKDTPAVFLYSPQFIYLVPKSLRGVEKTEHITVPSERFSQIYEWYITTEKVWKIFAPKGD